MFNWLFKKKEETTVIYPDYVMVSNVVIETTPAIGQPVLAIIEATKDLDRWEKVMLLEPYVLLCVVDNCTGVTYKVFSVMYSAPYLAGFSWMTSAEEQETIKALKTLNALLIAKEHEAQRKEMMKLYCKEEK